MYNDENGRTWQGTFPFTLASVKANAPSRLGVYQILYTGNLAPQVAYIGIATGDTIRGRLSKHVNGLGNWALARLGDPSKFVFVYWECDPASAAQIESHVITEQKPPFNVRPEFKDFIPSIAVH